MSPLEQQIAIAESNGYAWKSSDTAESGYTSWQDYINRCGEEVLRDAGVPDYLNDLNAMHEVENQLYKRIGMFGFERYLTHLQHIMNRVPPVQENMFFVSAPASQRAEAYLRTIGKWKD